MSLLDRPPVVVAAGVGVLSDALRAQGVEVHGVVWRPPGLGDPADQAALAPAPRRAAANRDDAQRGPAAGAGLVARRHARDGMTRLSFDL